MKGILIFLLALCMPAQLQAAEPKSLLACTPKAIDEARDGALVQPSKLSMDLAQAKSKVSHVIKSQDYHFKINKFSATILMEYIPEPSSIEFTVDYSPKPKGKEFDVDSYSPKVAKTLTLPISSTLGYQLDFRDASGKFPEISLNCELAPVVPEAVTQPARAGCGKP